MTAVVEEAPWWLEEQVAAGEMAVGEWRGAVVEPVLEEPDWEVRLRWEAAARPQQIDWAVPGVERFGDRAERQRPGPTPEVAALACAVERLAAVDPLSVPAEQALADLGALMRAKEQLRITELARYHDGHVRQLAAADDEPSLSSWVRRRYDDPDRGDIGLAKKLRPFAWLRAKVTDRSVPVPAAALAASALKQVRHLVDRPDGRIDGHAGDPIVDAVVGNVIDLVAGARLGLHDDHPLLAELQAQVEQITSSGDSQLGRLERAFTLMAEHIPVNLLKRSLEQQTDALLPDQLESRSEQAHQKREVRLDPNRFGGGGRITIDADDELYELATTCLTAEVRRDPANPTDTEAKRDLFGTEVEEAGDVRFPRTRGQRLHDGLVLLLHRYLAAGLAGTHDKQPVSVLITLSAKNLKNAPGALPARGSSGRSLPASLVRRLLCDAKVSTLVHTAGLIPLGITHEMRTLSAAERRAVTVQHGGTCDGLRCCTPLDPLTTLVPHHVHGFSVFGKTNLAETVLACPRLHDQIHRGKTVQLRSGRWLTEHGFTEGPES